MIQQFINYFYRYPKAKLKIYARFGGYTNYKFMLHQSKLMQSASLDLSPAQSYSDGLPIYFLTGKDYLYQTLFCIQSLIRTTVEKFNFILVDDGSFDISILNRLHKQLPGATIVTHEEIEKNIDRLLPKNLYPNLHHKRKIYPHLKKLTDIHTLGGSSWKLVLDSDMLFWREPHALINWLTKPKFCLAMQDCTDSYGYTIALMESLTGCPIPKLINVGAIGLNSKLLNWKKIDNWIKVLEEKEGATYYLEQALSAMVIAGNDKNILSSAEYIVNPNAYDILQKNGVLHHYVDLSKQDYFKYAWNQFYI